MQNEQDLVGMTFEEARLILNQIGQSFRVIEEKNVKFASFDSMESLPLYMTPGSLRISLIVDGQPYPDAITSHKSKVVKVIWG